MPTMPDLEELTARRSTRERRAPERFDPSVLRCDRIKSGFVTMFCLASTFMTSAPILASSYATKLVHQTQLVNQHFDGTFNYFHPLAFTETSDNETYTFKEMLQQEDKNEFIKAMLKEVQDHENRNHWHLFERDKIPQGHKTILAIWSFKRKRFPDGSINKYKSRLCAHGGMQQWGVDYWETYAPVVNWLSVRL